jgi:hypothetical protein
VRARPGETPPSRPTLPRLAFDDQGDPEDQSAFRAKRKPPWLLR